MSQTTASSPLVVRRDTAKALKDRIGWSWQKLAERLGLNPSQGTALSLAKRLISEQDLAWLAALADAVEALPRPEPVAEVQTMTPPSLPGMEQFVRGATDEQLEERGRMNARQEVAHAIASQYAAVATADYTDAGKVAARLVLGALAQSLDMLEDVRRLLAPKTQPEPPPHIGEGTADPPAWNPPMPRAEASGRVPF